MDEYSFRGGFDLYEDSDDDDGYDETKKIASVRSVFFEEDKMLNDGVDIVQIADMFDDNICNSMEHLSISPIYQEELNEDKKLLSLFTCYIETVYVYPEYRNNGIGQFIW